MGVIGANRLPVRISVRWRTSGSRGLCSHLNIHVNDQRNACVSFCLLQTRQAVSMEGAEVEHWDDFISFSWSIPQEDL